MSSDPPPTPAIGDAGEQSGSLQQVNPQQGLSFAEQRLLQAIVEANVARYHAGVQVDAAYEERRFRERIFASAHPGDSLLQAARDHERAFAIEEHARARHFWAVQAYRNALMAYRSWQDGRVPQPAAALEASQEPPSSSALPSVPNGAPPGSEPLQESAPSGSSPPARLTKQAPLVVTTPAVSTQAVSTQAATPQQQPQETQSNSVQGSDAPRYGPYGSWLAASIDQLPADTQEQDNTGQTSWYWQFPGLQASPEQEATDMATDATTHRGDSTAQTSYQETTSSGLRQLFAERLDQQVADSPEATATGSQQAPSQAHDATMVADHTDIGVVREEPPGLVADSAASNSGDSSAPETIDGEQPGQGLDTGDKPEADSLEEQQPSVS